jgi:hypothetical protein
MTDLEALVTISQTVLRTRGEWCVTGIDEILRRDIRNVVNDCAKLLRLSADYTETLEGMAVRELERRAGDAEPINQGAWGGKVPAHD